MSKKIKNLCVSVALAAVVGISAAASACTMKSKHPTARITIQFNEVNYEIDYTLYRNMYPQTVQHFIELADAGFYNEIIVHDYKTTDWVSGGYSYNAKQEETDDAGNASMVASNYDESYSRTGGMLEYLEANSKEKEYYELVTKGIKDGTFSASVYEKSIYVGEEEAVSIDNALPTVIGEFSNNNHKIKDDKGLTASYGTLKMVYYTKDVKDHVVVTNSFNQILECDYAYNCATSLFAMQVSNGASSYDASKYAVFGQLKNDKSKDNLEKLTDKIQDYVTSLGSSTKWTTSIETQVDKEDKYADVDQKFAMTVKPIVIKSVKIIKH